MPRDTAVQNVLDEVTRQADLDQINALVQRINTEKNDQPSVGPDCEHHSETTNSPKAGKEEKCRRAHEQAELDAKSAENKADHPHALVSSYQRGRVDRRCCSRRCPTRSRPTPTTGSPPDN